MLRLDRHAVRQFGSALHDDGHSRLDAGVEHFDVPPVVAPDVHDVPHMPQFSLSVFMSTHAPAHSVLPIGHWIAHVPFAHVHVPPPMIAPASLPQTLPHLPQFALSVFASTHTAPHFVDVAEHWQLPWTHVAPDGHALPHLPQFALSVFRSVH